MISQYISLLFDTNDQHLVSPVDLSFEHYDQTSGCQCIENPMQFMYCTTSIVARGNQQDNTVNKLLSRK